MRMIIQLLSGMVGCLVIFLIFVNIFKEDLGPFFSLAVPIGLILGLQIVILDKINKKS